MFALLMVEFKMSALAEKREEGWPLEAPDSAPRSRESTALESLPPNRESEELASGPRNRGSELLDESPARKRGSVGRELVVAVLNPRPNCAILLLPDAVVPCCGF
jgi:hypothetical protein